jgi:hypothetical protein
MRSYFKRPAETLRVTLDFAEFEAENPDASVTYELRADLGVVVQANLLGAGVFELVVEGGVNGRAYSFGIEARATYEDGSVGDSSVQLCKLRLRDVTTWPSVPVVGEVGLPTDFFMLVDADGNALVDADGNALVIAG